MKPSITSFLLFCIFLLFWNYPSGVRSEGSKEIYIGTNNIDLYLCNDFVGQCNGGQGFRTQFAIYGCNATDRLYFSSSTPQETIFMGFNGNTSGQNHIVFRIKDIAGN